MAVERTIVCDDCGTIGFASRMLAWARAEARKAGWISRGDLDRCVDCQESRKARYD